MVEGDPGSCCSSDFSLVGRNARSRSLPQVRIWDFIIWNSYLLIYISLKWIMLLWSCDIFTWKCWNNQKLYLAQTDFMEQSNASSCTGWFLSPCGRLRVPWMGLWSWKWLLPNWSRPRWKLHLSYWGVLGEQAYSKSWPCQKSPFKSYKLLQVYPPKVTILPSISEHFGKTGDGGDGQALLADFPSNGSGMLPRLSPCNQTWYKTKQSKIRIWQLLSWANV